MSWQSLKNSTYCWRGKNLQEQIVSGEISALSVNLAKIMLAKKGFKILSIKKKLSPFFVRKLKITSSDIIVFFRQFSTLIIAGIPIIQAIQILILNFEQAKLFAILSTLRDDITAGNNLAFGLQKFPRYFDAMTCSLIHAGEKSGTLDIMLERIANHKEKLARLKNKIKQALFYPAIIVLVATIVTTIMLTCIVPQFAELFHTMHSTLPLFTRVVIQIAYFIRHSLGLIIVVFISFGAGIYFTRRKPVVEHTLDNLLLKIPLIGPSLNKFILAGFARSLATVLAAGIPITEALAILAPSLGNRIYRLALQKVTFHISTGKQLHFAMQTCKLFPAMLLQMIQVGEESGTLEKMLIKVAEFYESDLDHFIENLSRLLEPLIMAILGVVIGGLVIAMYLPIFKLGAVI
jgi:type IV pilus assembly protein PilC